MSYPSAFPSEAGTVEPQLLCWDCMSWPRDCRIWEWNVTWGQVEGLGTGWEVLQLRGRGGRACANPQVWDSGTLGTSSVRGSISVRHPWLCLKQSLPILLAAVRVRRTMQQWIHVPWQQVSLSVGDFCLVLIKVISLGCGLGWLGRVQVRKESLGTCTVHPFDVSNWLHPRVLSLRLCFPQTVAHQAPPVHGISFRNSSSRKAYWSGLPFPSPRDLPDPEIEPSFPAAPALAGRFFTTEPPGKSAPSTCLTANFQNKPTYACCSKLYCWGFLSTSWQPTFGFSS